ncbi:MAG: MBL fold metallo-hydrolase [Anaerolineae bacterium]|nr:MBL fold metallo-hydrolase [Anaerolineae bacterium]
MEITWYGHSCFRMTERGKVTIVTDPYAGGLGLPPLNIKADVVTISHDSPGHNALEAIKSEPYVLRGPGEYEIGNVFITGIAMHNVTLETPQLNVAYLFDFDGLRVLHLGDLSFVPDQSLVEALGEVHALLIPVGGGNGLKATQAAEVVAMVEPSFIVPMHYELPGLTIPLEGVDKFLKAMGVTRPQEADTLKFNANDRPEQAQVVVLTPQS